MPVNPEVLRDLIRRFGAAAVKAAKEKVMVPNMTCTAAAESMSPGSPVGEGDPDFVGPPTPFPVKVANSTYREYDDEARKYDGEYPNIAYYLRNSGNLRGQRLGANEAMILDWPPENLMRIRGTKKYNVPVTKAALDSMALNGAKAGVSPEVALGIPAQETALGFYPTAAWIPEEMRSFAREMPNGYAANRWQITPVELMNDAAYANDPYGSSLSYVAKKLGVGVPLDDSSYKLRNNLSAEELARVEAMLAKDRGYADSQARRAGDPGSVFRHAYELYKSGKYNPGDPNYNSMVEAAGADVFTSPQIQDWWNTSGRKYYEQYAPTMLEDFRGGGKIHIKPENRGKFTALLNRTGKTASWYKAHGTPAQKKMAVFALNARKWKHEDGGFLQQYPDGGRIKGKRNGKFYVTELNDRREKKFQDWYANAAATLGLDPNPDAYEHAYDYRGYWLNNRDADVSSPDFHFPDTWKQPHHPTFSDESIYAKGHEGVGHWEGDRFVPGPFNNIMQATEPASAAPVAPTSYGSNYVPSDDILQYIKDTEAFRDQWYQDGNGVWTIGYGFTGDDVRKRYPNGMTRAEADQYFADTVSRRIPMFVGATPNFDRLNQNQRDALFSYYYNIGHGGYTRKSPAMQEALKNFDLDTVVNNIDFGYNDKKNRGLRKRRDYERKLFGTPMDYGGILNRLRNVYGDNESVKAAILRAKNVKK